MAKIVWDRPEDRTYEEGVEKGVLYVDGRPGVPWNGLVSVGDDPTSVEVEARYQDGVKMYNYTPVHEFGATISALTYPEEFEECLGNYEILQGISIDEQDRKTFGMAYQTTHGDATNLNTRNKIHLIYNATATPSTLVRETRTNDRTITPFEWSISTLPVEAPGYKPSSHFTIDGSLLGPLMFRYLCQQLFGSDQNDPTLLSPIEIIELVSNWHVLYPSSATYPSLDTYPGGP